MYLCVINIRKKMIQKSADFINVKNVEKIDTLLSLAITDRNYEWI